MNAKSKVPTGASVSGTENYFRRFSPVQAQEPRKFGRTGWLASFIGFGSYRVDQQTPEHREALTLALRSGCNLIDTSPNYREGAAEALIGDTLSAAFSEKSLQREELIIISKVGYVQGSELELARMRIEQDRPIPEMTQFAPDCWHCFSPEFISLQLTQSLARLKLETLDAVLLHNPEQFLQTGGSHAEYYERIKRAFLHLEEEVARGRIQFYGVSSNTFPEPKTSSDFTSLEILLEIASKISPNHHFAVIQCPFNLLESGAALEPNNAGKTVFETAAQAKLAVLTNRPFNAYPQNEPNAQMLRLTDPPGRGEVTEGFLEIFREKFQTALSDLMQLEAAYTGQEFVPAGSLSWGHLLRKKLPELTSLESWQRVLCTQIRPQLERALGVLSQSPEYHPWIDEYRFRS